MRSNVKNQLKSKRRLNDHDSHAFNSYRKTRDSSAIVFTSLVPSGADCRLVVLPDGKQAVEVTSVATRGCINKVSVDYWDEDGLVDVGDYVVFTNGVIMGAREL